MSGIFGGGGGTVNTVQNSDPWSGVQPYLRNLYSQANTAANRTPFSYTSSPYTTQAQQMTADIATNPNSLTNQSNQTLLNTVSPGYLDPSNNPYFAKSVNDALGLAKSQFAGQYGGSAGGNLGNSGYQEGLARTLGNVATNAYSDQYNKNLTNQTNAALAAPSVAFANPSALSGVGAQQEQQQLAAYNSPWSNLSNLQGALANAPGGTTTAQTPYYTNPLANALGMGLGGLALYNGLGGLLGTSAMGGTASGLATLAALG